MENENRLVKAKEVEEIFNYEVSVADKNPLDAFDSAIQNAATVDAMEVVRCKDCKHYDNSEGINWCNLNSKFYPGGMDWHSFPENGFCFYAERKNDGSA